MWKRGNCVYHPNALSPSLLCLCCDQSRILEVQWDVEQNRNSFGILRTRKKMSSPDLITRQNI